MAEQTVPAGHVPAWTLGDRLAKARAYAGLAQKDMAQKFEVTPAAISQWENDIRKPRYLRTVVSRWAEITGVDLEWLMWGTLQSACLSIVDLTDDPLNEQLTLQPPPELEVIVTSAAG